MAKVYAFLADGFEEVECLAVADVLIRAGVEVKLISMGAERQVEGSHHFRIMADQLFAETDCREADVLFLPGGVPGTPNLKAHQGLLEALLQAAGENRRLAAICAAPSVLGSIGILRDRKATCYPGYEKELLGAEHTGCGVVTDGNITTARGLGYALDLGLELVKLLVDETTARQIKAAIQYDQF